MRIQCTQCQFQPSDRETPYLCPVCGGYFEYTARAEFDPKKINYNQPGIWRYTATFGLSDQVKPVSLGEGNTPLVWDRVGGKRVAFKLDYLNPTGSYKDRGTTVLISYLAWQGVETAIEDSSGNAGASFAAYCSRAGIQGRVYVPDYASGPKRAQIEAYGCELVPVPGPRSNAADAVKQESDGGVVYASHVYQPFVFPGYATAAYEIVEQLDGAPGSVIVPAGQGSFLLGISRGFETLIRDDMISKMPQIIGVQSKACAPLWAASQSDTDEIEQTDEGETVAEGIRVSKPLRGKQVLQAVKSSQGWMAAVQEADILPARDELARRGFYVEPTSAVVWPALLEKIDELRDPIVVIFTGSGLKYNP